MVSVVRRYVEAILVEGAARDVVRIEEGGHCMRVMKCKGADQLILF